MFNEFRWNCPCVRRHQMWIWRFERDVCEILVDNKFFGFFTFNLTLNFTNQDVVANWSLHTRAMKDTERTEMTKTRQPPFHRYTREPVPDPMAACAGVRHTVGYTILCMCDMDVLCVRRIASARIFAPTHTHRVTVSYASLLKCIRVWFI